MYEFKETLKEGTEEEENCIYNVTDASVYLSDNPPLHYTLKVNPFSELSNLLSKTGTAKYDSCDFESGGYKWKLSLYPHGDGKRGGKGHISLYLVLAEANTLPLGQEIRTFFKLFVYDQIRNNYLTVQYKAETRFHAIKTEWGFTKLLELTTFSNAANGYLVDDCCIFGADVFVENCRGRGESLTVIKGPQISYFSWKTNKFSTIREEFISSAKFTNEGHEWCLIVYPRGDLSVKDKCLSFYLKLETPLGPQEKIFVQYALCLNHHEYSDSKWFSSSAMLSGWSNFMTLSELKTKKEGYIVKDSLVVEARIAVCSMVKNFS